jgi:Spx/MgsR family transcriptional regulator
MAITLYGIKNCDTIKKARKYLDAQGVEYTFHDYRADGIDTGLVQSFVKSLGWENVLNKRGTTWRTLDDKTKATIDETSVIPLLCENPAMIKRPILQQGKVLTLGFSPASYDKLFT